MNTLPNPARNVFRCWVFQPLDIIQVSVIQLIQDWLENALDISEVHDPARIWINRSLYIEPGSERMSVQSKTFVIRREIWQPVRCFKTKFLEYLH